MHKKPITELTFSEKLVYAINQAYGTQYTMANFIKWGTVFWRLNRDKKPHHKVYRLRGYVVVIDPVLKIK